MVEVFKIILHNGVKSHVSYKIHGYEILFNRAASGRLTPKIFVKLFAIYVQFYFVSLYN